MTKTKATLIGCIAIMLWSIDTIINIYLTRLPVFEVLSISWLLAFVIYALILSYRRKWMEVRQKPVVWIIGTLGLCGAHFCMVAGLRQAPPEQVTTLAAIWPIWVVVFGGWLLNKEKLTWISALGAIIGFVGVSVVLTNGKLLSGFQLNYSLGYTFALLSSVLWTFYVLMTRRFTNISSQMMGMYMGVGGLFALAYHLRAEKFVTPFPMEMLWLFIKGAVTLSGSYFCWDYAIKRGHFVLLNSLAYFNPIIAILLLAIVGVSFAMLPISMGAGLVVMGALMCGRANHKLGRSPCRPAS